MDNKGNRHRIYQFGIEIVVPDRSHGTEFDQTGAERS